MFIIVCSNTNIAEVFLTTYRSKFSEKSFDGTKFKNCCK